MLSRWSIARINWPGLAVLALVLAIWEIVVRSGAVSFEFFPAPTSILSGAVELARDGILFQDLLHTLLSIAMGWTIAMVIGVSIGLLLGFSPLVRRYGMASIEVLRPVPGIAFAPLGLLLFGFSLQTELVVTVLPTVWPVMINTMGGIANVQPRLTDVGRTGTFCFPPPCHLSLWARGSVLVLHLSWRSSPRSSAIPLAWDTGSCVSSRPCIRNICSPISRWLACWGLF